MTVTFIIILFAIYAWQVPFALQWYILNWITVSFLEGKNDFTKETNKGSRNFIYSQWIALYINTFYHSNSNSNFHLMKLCSLSPKYPVVTKREEFINMKRNRLIISKRRNLISPWVTIIFLESRDFSLPWSFHQSHYNFKRPCWKCSRSFELMRGLGSGGKRNCYNI